MHGELPGGDPVGRRPEGADTRTLPEPGRMMMLLGCLPAARRALQKINCTCAPTLAAARELVFTSSSVSAAITGSFSATDT